MLSCELFFSLSHSSFFSFPLLSVCNTYWHQLIRVVFFSLVHSIFDTVTTRLFDNQQIQSIVFRHGNIFLLSLLLWHCLWLFSSVWFSENLPMAFQCFGTFNFIWLSSVRFGSVWFWHGSMRSTSLLTTLQSKR